MNFDDNDRIVKYCVCENLDGTWFVYRTCYREEVNSQKEGSFLTKEEAEMEMKRIKFDEKASWGLERPV